MQERHRLIQLKEQYESWSKLPKYLLFANVLAQYLSEQQLPPGSRLLSIRQLAEKLDTTLVTLTRAIDELSRRHLVERRQGSGIYTCVQNTKSKKRIGIISHALIGSNDPQDGQILQNIHAFWKHYHYDICQLPADPDEYERVFIDYELDGIIILHPQQTALPYLCKLAENKIPVVSIGNAAADFEGIAFGTDHGKLARQAVEYLLNKGYSRIGFIGSKLNDSSDRMYQLGYLQAMFDARIPVSPDWNTVFGESLEASLKKSAVSGMLPEVFILTSSRMYVSELCDLCCKLQIKMPEELVLLTLHCEAFDGISEPPLTVFPQKLDDFTGHAMASLLHQITHGTPLSGSSDSPSCLNMHTSPGPSSENNNSDFDHNN